MKEIIMKLASKILGFDLGAIVMVVMMVNALIFTTQVFLQSCKKVLDEYKDKTKNELDNKAAVIVGNLAGSLAKILETLTKILDLVGANRKH